MAQVLVVTTVVPTGVGVTLQRYRQILADELGFWHATTVTSVAVGGEAARFVLAADLRDDENGFEFLGAPWVYVRSGAQAGTQARIIGQEDAGYLGSLGGLQVARPFGAALSTNDVVEITAPLPVKRYVAQKGLNDCIDAALSHLWVEAILTVTGNGTREYDLASAPYITRAEQLRGVYDTLWLGPPTTQTLSPWAGELRLDGATRTLVTEQTYATADTFYLHLAVRADRLVYDGSAWSFVTTPGLANDAYQALADENHVKAVGMVMALRQLAKLTMATRKLDRAEKQLALADLADRRRSWARAANRIKALAGPTPLQIRTEPIARADPLPVWV